MVKHTLQDKSGNPESPKKIIATVQKLFIKCTHSGQEFAEGVLRVVSFTVLWFKWSVKKSCAAKVFLAIWEMLWHENNRNCHSYRFSHNSLLSSFCSFLQSKNKNQVFSRLVAWYREIFLFFLFIASCALLQSPVEFKRLL